MSSMLCPVLVGREQHTRALRDGLEAALGGAGRIVVVLGEAGVGKSRLARELASEARRHCTVLTGRALPGHGSTGLRALADALQPAFRTRRPPNVDELRPFVAALVSWLDCGAGASGWGAVGAPACVSQPRMATTTLAITAHITRIALPERRSFARLRSKLTVRSIAKTAARIVANRVWSIAGCFPTQAGRV